MATSTNATNQASKAAAQSVPNIAGTPKRQRSAQTTPINQPKKPRTFADVVMDDLKILIVNKTDAITPDLLELLETSLMDELERYLATSPVSVPTYHTSTFRFGTLKLICTDSFSAEWIKTL